MKAPIKDFNLLSYPQGSVTQFFGENPSLYKRVICVPDGDKKYCLQGHNGVDIVAPWGTPIYAVESGKAVTVKDSATGFGKHVRLVNFDTGHEWTYGHLARINVKQDTWVEAGTQIGTMGNTGFVVSGSTPYWKHNPYAGTHLHLGLRKVSKRGGVKTTYLNGETARVQDWRNGYYGAIDWMPLWKQEDEAKLPLLLTVRSLANQAIDLLNKLLARQR